MAADLSAGQDDAEEAAGACYSCGSEVPAGQRSCPTCGRRQLRDCYCGAQIPVTASRCPRCGADWSQSVRVRRKTRSRRVRPKALALHAVIGAGLALVLAGLADTLVGTLAAASLGPDQEMPHGIVDKLGLALVTIGAWFSSLAHVILRHRPALQSVLTVAVLGALLGTVIYLTRSGILRRAASSRSARRRRRR